MTEPSAARSRPAELASASVVVENQSHRFTLPLSQVNCNQGHFASTAVLAYARPLGQPSLACAAWLPPRLGSPRTPPLPRFRSVPRRKDPARSPKARRSAFFFRLLVRTLAMRIHCHGVETASGTNIRPYGPFQELRKPFAKLLPSAFPHRLHT